MIEGTESIKEDLKRKVEVVVEAVVKFQYWPQ